MEYYALFVVAAFAILGTQAKASPSKNGDGIVIHSQHAAGNRLPQQQEILITKPSEDDKCTDGDKKPNKDSCRDYYVCENNKYEDDYCWWPRKFDSIDLKCEYWGARCAGSDPTTSPVTEPTKPTEPITNTTPATPTNPNTTPTNPNTAPTTPNTAPTNPNTKPSPAVPTPTPTPSSSGYHLPSYFIISLSVYLGTISFARL